MARRRKAPSLKVACMINIARHMERIWCADYYRNFHDQGNFLHVLGPFECLTPCLIQELINILVTRSWMKRYFLHLLIDGRLETLDLGICRKAANKDSIVNLVTIRCQRLVRLNIANCNQVSARVLADLVAALPNITSLTMRHTKCTDQVLAQIGLNCKNLRELDIYGCPVTDMGLMSLCVSFDPKQPKVEKLCKIDIGLNFNSITHKGVEILLNNCKNLQILLYADLCDALYIYHQKRDEGSEAKQLTSLQTLYMSQMKECKHSPTAAVQVSCCLCPNVTEAQMLRGLTNEGLLFLSGLQHLRILHLANGGNGEEVTFEGGLLPFLQIRGSSLQELTLSEVNMLDISIIGHCCPKLKKFSCLVAGFNCAHFPMNTEPDLVAGLANVVPFKELRELKIQIYAEQNDFPGQFLRQLLYHCSRLRELHLSQIHCLDDELLYDVLQQNSLQYLESLVLESCHNIAVGPIYDLCEATNELHHLVLKYCRGITRIDSEQLDMMAEEDNFDLVTEWS